MKKIKATDYWKQQAREIMGKKTPKNEETAQENYTDDNDVLDDSVLDIEEDFFPVDRKEKKNTYQDNTGDYFDIYTGEYLGSDGTGNKIRFSSKALWNTINHRYPNGKYAPPQLAQSGNICFGSLDDQESWDKNVASMIDRNTLVKIVEHYYNKLGYSFDELQYDDKTQSYISDNEEALASMGGGENGKKLKLGWNFKYMKPNREIQNANDIVSLIVHERMGHGQDRINNHYGYSIPIPEGVSYKGSRRAEVLEGRATWIQIQHPSWKNTSLKLKQNMYEVYGKYINPNNHKTFFFDYGVVKRDLPILDKQKEADSYIKD